MSVIKNNNFLKCTVILHCLLIFLIMASCSSVTPLEKTLATPKRGEYQVGYKDIEWTDNNRNRNIRTALWYPSFEPSERINYLAFEGFAKTDSNISDGQFPLIIVSHGTGGHRYNQFYLTEFLASYGYIVVAIEHPYNNAFNNKDHGSVANLWNRPKDISFIIDQLLTNEDLSPYIDENKIGFIGHSIGGYTGFVLAGAIPDFQLVIDYCKQHPEDRLMCDTLNREKEKESNYIFDFSVLDDQRIKALFLMAPALGQAFNSANMSNVDIPILLIGSGKDEVLKEPYNIVRYRNTLKDRINYIEFPNAGHYVYLQECPFLVTLLAGEACNDIGTPRSEIHPKLRQLSIDFFDDKLE